MKQMILRTFGKVGGMTPLRRIVGAIWPVVVAFVAPIVAITAYVVGMDAIVLSVALWVTAALLFAVPLALHGLAEDWEHEARLNPPRLRRVRAAVRTRALAQVTASDLKRLGNIRTANEHTGPDSPHRAVEWSEVHWRS